MTEKEIQCQRILLEDFALAKGKLEALQATAAREALALKEIAEHLQCAEDRYQVVALSALECHLSGKLAKLVKDLLEACDERAELGRMLAERGITIGD